jgi:hypothetical protein
MDSDVISALVLDVMSQILDVLFEHNTGPVGRREIDLLHVSGMSTLSSHYGRLVHGPRPSAAAHAKSDQSYSGFQRQA